jgi:hypothetical protein
VSSLSSTKRFGPVWTKTPLILLRYPGLAAGLALGALLLAIAVAAYPLFISASASTLVEAELGKPLVTRYGAGMTYRNSEIPFDQPAPVGMGPGLRHELIGDAFDETAGESPYLGPTISSIVGPTVSISPVGHPERIRSARLFAGTGAIRHVRVLGGRQGPGVWLPDLVADALRVGPGDRIELAHQTGSVDLAIDGVYDALYSQPLSGYWVQWIDDVYPPCPDCSPPPQFAILGHGQLIDISRQLDVTEASFAWQAPLDAATELTLSGARDLSRFVERFRALISDEGTATGRLFDCCYLFHTGFRHESRVVSRINQVVSRVEERMTVIEGPGRLLETAGVVVALAVIAAAGAFGMAARRTEARLLFARGTGRVAVAATASLESILPCVVGAAVGLGLAFLLARAAGSDAQLESEARNAAFGASALAMLGSTLAVGLVSAASFGGTVEHHRSRWQPLWRMPWELALLAFAFYAYRRLPAGGGFVSTSDLRPDVFILLFPLSLIGGFALLGARLFRDVFRGLRDRTGTSGPTPYLVVHRLAGAGDITVLLLAAAVLTLGTFVQGRTLVRSLETTVDAKAKVFVGSDVHGWVHPEAQIPDDFPLPATKVTRQSEAGTLDPGGGSFDLLAVDPETLPEGAYWLDRFSDVSLQEIARRLGEPPEDQRIPVAVAGGGGRIDSMELQQRLLPVRVVARTTAFPGMLSKRPLVVADAEFIRGEFDRTGNPLDNGNAATELWVRGDRRSAVRALSSLDPPPYQTITAAEVRDVPYISAVIGTFTVLNALGLAAGALVIAATLMYLQARERAQIVAFGLSLRMGSSPPAHRWWLAIEMATMLVWSYLLAVVLALAAVFLMAGFLDPLPAIPPAPLVDVPVALIAAALGVLIVVSWAGAWYMTRRAAATRLGEVMRVAE